MFYFGRTQHNLSVKGNLQDSCWEEVFQWIVLQIVDWKSILTSDLGLY